MENTVGPRRMKLSPAYPMRAAWLLAFISLLMLLTASAVAEECGCTAHAASDHIELETNAAPTVTRERVFEEAANTAQQMREIRMKGGFVTYGTVDAIIYVDQEGIKTATIKDYYIDETETTNAEFALFVKATNYTTSAEKHGWSFVFFTLLPKEVVEAKETQRVRDAPWHIQVDGARWDAPEGPGTSILTRLQHPVVHISYPDAVAYCQWKGKRPPSEAEWEHAAHGGKHSDNPYPWGVEITPGGKHVCNIWQGKFPVTNSAEDGWAGTAPVKTYPPNSVGLYQMIGNVWEWVSTQKNDLRLLKGGSFLCHQAYCTRYRVAARSTAEDDSSGIHFGLRCARDA